MTAIGVLLVASVDLGVGIFGLVASGGGGGWADDTVRVVAATATVVSGADLTLLVVVLVVLLLLLLLVVAAKFGGCDGNGYCSGLMMGVDVPLLADGLLYGGLFMGDDPVASRCWCN